MGIVIFQKENNLEDSLGNFRDLYYSSQMNYLASDLLHEGISPSEIRRAVQKAMTTCQTASVEIRKHFIPVYTQVENEIVKDCKLSRLGYGLVLLNTNVNISVAAHWQLKVLKDFFK